jgi:hypothetical protein
MKSIERSFNKIKHNNPNWGDYVCLADTVKYKGYCRRKIYMYFRKLVSKEDYSSKEVNSLVRYLWKLSNSSEGDIFLKDYDRYGNKKRYLNVFTKIENSTQH